MKSSDQVWYSISRTINTGNFQSVKFEIGESRTVDEDPEKTYVDLRKTVNARMSAIIKKMETPDE